MKVRLSSGPGLDRQVYQVMNEMTEEEWTGFEAAFPSLENGVMWEPFRDRWDARRMAVLPEQVKEWIEQHTRIRWDDEGAYREVDQ